MWEPSTHGDGKGPGIKLTTKGRLTSGRVEISIVPPHRSNEAAIRGIYDAGTGDTGPVEETGVMRRGESWTFSVVPVTDTDGLDRGGTAKLRCVCYADGYDPWVVVVSVDMPGTPRVRWA
jgi:hypothetical protein